MFTRFAVAVALSSLSSMGAAAGEAQTEGPARSTAIAQERTSLRDAIDNLIGESVRLVGEPSVMEADGEAFDGFGGAIAVDGDTVLVSAPADDVGANLDQGSAYVFRRSGATWSLQAKLTIPGGAANAFMGRRSVALEGDTALIGAPAQDIDGRSSQGAAYVFVRAGTNWTLQARLTATDGGAGDEFGAAVALSGETALVGASGARVGASQGVGAAYVFERSGGDWTQQAKLAAQDGRASGSFGAAVALSGGSALIGAPLGDVVENDNQGTAYLFVRDSAGWREVQKLVASSGATDSRFGGAVDLEAGVAVVGASGARVGGDLWRGAAYVFTADGDAWTQDATLVAADGAEFHAFGASVALAGGRLLVGAVNTNAAYVFGRSGAVWQQSAKLEPPVGYPAGQFGSAVAIDSGSALVGAPSARVEGRQAQGAAHVFAVSGVSVASPTTLTSGRGSGGHEFGRVVALSDQTALVSSPSAISNGGQSVGVVYVFRRLDGIWTLDGTLVPPAATAGGGFGKAIAFSGDTVLVGAPFESVGANGQEGAVYAFFRIGNAWIYQARLEAADAESGSLFGESIALSGDTALIGSGFRSVDANVRQGAAYVFVRDGSTWGQQAKLTAADGAAGDQFGLSVAISGDSALVGANGHDVGPNEDQGAAYLFDRTGAVWSQRAKLLAVDGVPRSEYGRAVALDGDVALVGAPAMNAAALNQGAVYAFRLASGAWVSMGKLVAIDGAPGDYFGGSLALSGRRVVIGAPMAGAASAGRPGAMYVFDRIGQAWLDQGSVRIASSAPGDRFATAVALNGTIALAGSPGSDGSPPYGNPDEGTAELVFFDRLFGDGFEPAFQ